MDSQKSFLIHRSQSSNKEEEDDIIEYAIEIFVCSFVTWFEYLLSFNFFEMLGVWHSVKLVEIG